MIGIDDRAFLGIPREREFKFNSVAKAIEKLPKLAERLPEDFRVEYVKIVFIEGRPE